MTRNSSVKYIAQNAIVAAIYFVITIALAPYSYMGVQFRVAEVLVLLCFWRPDLVIGVTLGCFLSNTMSSLGAWDMLFGTLATLVSSLMVVYCSPRLWVSTIYPVVVNGLTVGAELYYLLQLDFWTQAGLVAAGEAAVMVVGYFLWFFLRKNQGFMKFIAPTRHQSITC
jgi:uncharacterized membrane protein